MIDARHDPGMSTQDLRITIHIQPGRTPEETEHWIDQVQQAELLAEAADSPLPVPDGQEIRPSTDMAPNEWCETPKKSSASTSPEKVDSARSFRSKKEPTNDADHANQLTRKVAVEFLRKRTQERQDNKDLEQGIRREGERWRPIIDKAAREFDKSRGLA